jgi:hypothetical protein
MTGECPKAAWNVNNIATGDLVSTHPIDESIIPCCNKTTFLESCLKE